MPAKEILKIGDKLFSDKEAVDSLHQEIAENFYPERADFTNKRTPGEEFAEGLFSSTPVLARRELGNMMSASLRPRSTPWFHIRANADQLNEGKAERAYLDYISDIQWQAMYENRAGFVRATKQADHDFAAFGNCVIHIGPNADGNGLLYRNHHLRDCAWSENSEGKVDALHRNWSPTARQLEHLFPKTVSKEVAKCVKKDPEKEFKVRHAVIPSRMYGNKRYQYYSLFIERDTENILEEVGINIFPYVVPRWQTVSGSQYGTSMATSVILPDGRTMQAVVRTLREAGEKYVDPPMIAVSDAIRGDMALYAGGVTTADIEYDERLGEVLRPISQDRGGIPIGIEIAESLKADIASGFFLDKIQLPEARVEMTAFEVRRRLEEHIRASAPIFEPIEEEYSDPVCETTFQMLMQFGAFPLQEMPDSLRDSEVRFDFRSPLADMTEQRDAEIFLDGINRFLMPVAQFDPAQIRNAKMTTALRAALLSAGWKAEWLDDEDAVAAEQQRMEKQAQMAQGIDTLGQVGDIAKNLDTTQKA